MSPLIDVFEEVVEDGEAEVGDAKICVDVYTFSVIGKRAMLLFKNCLDYVELFDKRGYVVVYPHISTVANH